MCRNEVHGVAIPAEDIAKLRAANPHGTLQHGCKDRLKIARRTADNLQHLRRGSLLLQGFSEVIGAFAELVAQFAAQVIV